MGNTPQGHTQHSFIVNNQQNQRKADEEKKIDQRQENSSNIQQGEVNSNSTYSFIVNNQQNQRNAVEEKEIDQDIQSNNQSSQSETKIIGIAPIFNIDPIPNSYISINYEPWLQQRLKELGKYEPNQDKPIEQFQDDQLKFVSNETLTDQSIYEGYMKDGKKHGYGINLFRNELFEGNFQDGIRKGWGRSITKDAVASGYWDNDKMQGELKTKDIHYKGQCNASVPNGYGELERSNSKYKGNFVNGRMQGKGVYEDLVQNTKYEGDFLMDKFHGFGTYYFSSGKKYVGQFKDSKFDGQGEMIWPLNRYYKGNFVNGLFDGWGYFIDDDQSKYDGYFKNGKKNGKGRLTNKNIDIKGMWENDVFQEGK